MLEIIAFCCGALVMVLEMVGDLLDSAGVCVQGVDVCSRNR